MWARGLTLAGTFIEAVVAAISLVLMVAPGNTFEWALVIVLCFALARYISRSPCQVILVILASLPGTPWSFTAEPMS